MKSSTGCSQDCVMSTGADLIPDHDYCAVRFNTLDTNVIERCATTDSQQACIAAPNMACEWRRGKVEAGNDEITTTMTDKELFSVNFCHPPTTDKWMENAPACLAKMSKNACTQKVGCNWSTGQEVVPVDEVKVCLPMKVSLNAQDYKTC